jgi:hypothetical protein
VRSEPRTGSRGATVAQSARDPVRPPTPAARRPSACTGPACPRGVLGAAIPGLRARGDVEDGGGRCGGSSPLPLAPLACHHDGMRLRAYYRARIFVGDGRLNKRVPFAAGLDALNAVSLRTSA